MNHPMNEGNNGYLAERPEDIQNYPQHQSSTTSLILDPHSLDKMMRLADIMAKGVATLPRHLQGNPSDCLAVIMQSMQWKMNPYAVAQKTHTVHGVLGYEAQLVNAVIISNAPITGRPNYRWFGDWSKVTGKFDIRKNAEGQEYRVPGWKLADEEGLGVEVWATVKGEDEPRVLSLLLAQARTRNSGLWADDPQQQLAYLALKKWSRLHTPDVILGVYSADELEPQERVEREVNPRPEARAEEVTQDYPQEDFKKNLPAWEKKIMAGKASADFIATKVETKGQMTAAQMGDLRKIEEKAQANATAKAEAAENQTTEA